MSYWTFSEEFIIIIMSCRRHGYPWPSLATSPYRSPPLVGLQGHIPYPHIAAECMFELVVLLLPSHMWGFRRVRIIIIWGYSRNTLHILICNLCGNGSSIKLMIYFPCLQIWSVMILTWTSEHHMFVVDTFFKTGEFVIVRETFFRWCWNGAVPEKKKLILSWVENSIQNSIIPI